MTDLRKKGVRRRRFLQSVPAAVAGWSSRPGACAGAPEQARRVNKEMLECGEKIFGVDFSDAEEEEALTGVNRNLDAFDQLRAIDVPLDTEPAVTFRPYLPGKRPKPGATPGREDQGHAAGPGSRPLLARGSRVPAGHRAGATRAAPRGLVDRPDPDVPRPAQEASGRGSIASSR